jgi:tetratricopeptide (TPR) repeat protein
MERFNRAVELYEEKDYAAALIEFKRAYDLAPSYKLLYKIGQVSYQLKDYAGALKAFERYVADGGDKLSAERKKQVREEIDVLKSQTGYIAVQANVFGAQVTIDDVLVGATPLDEPVLVSIGRRRVVVSADGRAPVTRVVNVAGRETKKISVDLPEVSTKPRTVVKKRSEPAGSPMTTWSWVGIGASAALGIGATVTGVLALRQSSELEDMTYAGDTPSNSIKAKQSNVKALALGTDILAGAAILTLGTTLFLTFSRSPSPSTGDPSSNSASVQPIISVRGLGLQGRF